MASPSLENANRKLYFIQQKSTLPCVQMCVHDSNRSRNPPIYHILRMQDIIQIPSLR